MHGGICIIEIKLLTKISDRRNNAVTMSKPTAATEVATEKLKIVRQAS